MADLLGGLGVDKAKKCEICFTRWIRDWSHPNSRLSPSEDAKCAECIQLAKKAAEKGATSDHMPDDSAKIRMLLQLITKVEERSGKKEKTIVFSQFTSFLNLVEPFLRSAGIAFVRCE